MNGRPQSDLCSVQSHTPTSLKHQQKLPPTSTVEEPFPKSFLLMKNKNHFLPLNLDFTPHRLLRLTSSHRPCFRWAAAEVRLLLDDGGAEQSGADVGAEDRNKRGGAGEGEKQVVVPTTYNIGKLEAREDVCKNPTAVDQQEATVWVSWFRPGSGQKGTTVRPGRREEEEMSFNVL